MSMQKGGVGVLFQLLQCLNRPRQTTLKQLCQTFPWSLSVYSLKLRQSGEIMLWFDCWTTGSRHCSNSFTSSHNIQTSSFAINQFSLIHSFHFTKKGVTYTCFLARWVDKEIEMPAACFTAQLGGEAFFAARFGADMQRAVRSLQHRAKLWEKFGILQLQYCLVYSNVPIHALRSTSIFNGISLRPLSLSHLPFAYVFTFLYRDALYVVCSSS